MNKIMRRIVFIALDFFCCLAALVSARLVSVQGDSLPQVFGGGMLWQLLFALALTLLFSVLFDTYDALWVYIGFSEVFRQLLTAVCTMTALKLCSLTGRFAMPLTVTLLFGFLLFFFTCLFRGTSRFMHWLNTRHGRADLVRTLMVGAGEAGAMVIRDLQYRRDGYLPVAAVDDDPYKQGMKIARIPIAGAIEEIPAVCGKHRIKHVIIAMPSALRARIQRVCEICVDAGLSVSIFQSATDVKSYLSGNRAALKEVSIDDLLFRTGIQPDMNPVSRFLKDKTVLVTGGAGSIGSEICRQVLAFDCRKLIVVDFNENALFELNEELKEKHRNYRIFLASIRDRQRLQKLFEEEPIDVVFHAAAHKHVPMMETNPFEAVKNNVTGTNNVIDCCVRNGVGRFILISTDKAVNPTNIMGASKRLAELLVQMRHGENGCRMAAVRFGNVLGAVGSVVPLFQRQIARGGPVKVTHKNMKRYFMTIPEAVSLVLTTGVLAENGEIFVLDMGKPVLIMDLAYNLIKLSGLEPEKDITIEEVGLRPGEKLFEELALSSEVVDKSRFEKIFVMQPCEMDKTAITKGLDVVLKITEKESEPEILREKMFGLIKETSG